MMNDTGTCPSHGSLLVGKPPFSPKCGRCEAEIALIRVWYREDAAYQKACKESYMTANARKVTEALDAIPDQPNYADYAEAMYAPEGCGMLCGCEKCIEARNDEWAFRRDQAIPEHAR